MCLHLYLGSPIKLPLVPFDKEKRAFSVDLAEQPYEKDLGELMNAEIVYVLGSHTGCGCGWHVGRKNPDEDTLRDFELLGRYLSAHLGNQMYKLMFTWWNHEYLSYERIPFERLQVFDSLELETIYTVNFKK